MEGRSRTGVLWREAALAAAVFVALCIAVLSVAPKSAEPDDGAYRASIVGIATGHFLSCRPLRQRLSRGSLVTTRTPHPTSGSNLLTAGTSARRTRDTRSSPPRSSRSASSGGHRCSTARWPAWGSSSARGVGLASSAAGRSGLVLLVGCSAGVCVARLHADLHRFVAHRGGSRRVALGSTQHRSELAPAHAGRPRRVHRDRAGHGRPLHRHRGTRLRRRDGDRRVAAGPRTSPTGW